MNEENETEENNKVIGHLVGKTTAASAKLLAIHLRH